MPIFAMGLDCAIDNGPGFLDFAPLLAKPRRLNERLGSGALLAGRDAIGRRSLFARHAWGGLFPGKGLEKRTKKAAFKRPWRTLCSVKP